MKKLAGKFRFSWLSLLLLVVLLAAGGVSYGLATANPDPASLEQELPLIGSYDHLLQLLEQAQGQGNYYFDPNRINMSKTTLEAAGAQANDGVAVPGAVPDYSGTNLQVAGVDEGDLVKTDGSYIYQVNRERVLIIKAQPAEQMELSATLEFVDKGFSPVDLYLDAQHLIVIGSYSRAVPMRPVDNDLKIQIYPPIRSFQSTRAIIYNISDPTHVRKIRELELEGSYLSSRKVGSAFYLLTNKYLDYYYIQQQQEMVPVWRDTVQGEAYVAEKLEEIRYFPDCVRPNYLLTAALDLNAPTARADIHAYLGSGDQVYASQQNLYVAVHRNDYPIPLNLPVSGSIYQPTDSITKIYKFALQPGQVKYAGIGQVPGRILNQFSMDENEGFLRVATTSGEVWRDDKYTSSNNVYILDQDLKVFGKLENIAPGERIYSTRFMGSRAYMVTFKQVDPFFVLDLRDPVHPAVLGKLKIPGYSDYLHPYDENHIIGFGKDTVEAKGWNGDSMAFYQGMKIAIFDVTDVSQPVEMSRALIGDRGTDSELLRNHKALLFSAEKNLLAFPVTVMEVDHGTAAGQPVASVPEYGSFAFQGLYVYEVDVNSGLRYRGRITHLSPEEYLKAGNSWYSSDKNVERALYIGENLYTLSPAMIKVNHLANLAEIKALTLPPAPVREVMVIEPGARNGAE